MNREDWKEHYEAVGEAEGYKVIYIADDKKEIEDREKLRSEIEVGKKKVIAANFKKDRAARKRHYVKMLILRAKNNKAFADACKKKVV